MSGSLNPSKSTPVPWGSDLGVIDTLIGFPANPDQVYAGIRSSLRDRESLEDFEMPASYMFHDIPAGQRPPAISTAVDATRLEMDRYGIAVGLVSVSSNQEVSEAAVASHPDRFVASWSIDPNEGVAGIRALVSAHERFGLRAVSFFPHGTKPQIAIDAPLAYAYYARCVELGLPVFVTVGIAGPRVPSLVQHVERLDQVMYDFPELVMVMRHGAEPWTDLAVKLMLKWPNLYYSTSAFAPRYYPRAIIDFANTRGSHKVMYAGYYPMGLSLERIFTEMPAVPFRDHVWPRFLRDNAAAVLKIGGSK
jgi:predicted TIM-barrel fold metal-dependent hydrolase